MILHHSLVLLAFILVLHFLVFSFFDMFLLILGCGFLVRSRFILGFVCLTIIASSNCSVLDNYLLIKIKQLQLNTKLYM